MSKAKRNRKNQTNYLDFVPVKNKNFTWDTNEQGIVVVQIVRTGFYDKIAQKFFKVPATSKIDLDEYGSFVWKNIDGKKSIYDIAELVKVKFGKGAEPLYNRLVKYFQILHDHKFITYNTCNNDGK